MEKELKEKAQDYYDNELQNYNPSRTTNEEMIVEMLTNFALEIIKEKDEEIRILKLTDRTGNKLIMKQASEIQTLKEKIKKYQYAIRKGIDYIDVDESKKP